MDVKGSKKATAKYGHYKIHMVKSMWLNCLELEVPSTEVVHHLNSNFDVSCVISCHIKFSQILASKYDLSLVPRLFLGPWCKANTTPDIISTRMNWISHILGTVNCCK